MTTKPIRFLFMSYLAGLSMLGFLATDMYLPAFSVMQNQLHTSPQNISATLSVFLGGYALAQLIWGPLSDRFGKKIVLLVGLTLFALSSLVIFVTHSINFILILRLIQAIGVCSAAVSWQSLVIDRYPQDQVKRIFATIMPLVALSPALAPLVGAFLLEHLGWRSIFIVLCLAACVLIIATFFIQESTTKISKSLKKPINYFHLLRSRIFMGNVLIYAVCSASFFAWLTGSPFILSNLGYSPSVIGLSYVPQTIAFLLGGYGYRFIAGRISNQSILPKILVIYSLCMIVMFVLILITSPNLTMLLIPFCVMALVNGACYPIVVSEALIPFPQSSGKAAALQNTIQLGSCFIASSIVSAFSDTPLLATSIVMICTVPFVILGYILSLKKKNKLWQLINWH